MWYCLSDICQSSGSFAFIKISITGIFWFLLVNDVLKKQLSEEFGKNCGRPLFSEELVGCKKFFEGFTAF